MKSFSSVREIKVGLQFDREVLPVGRLAIRAQDVYFEFDASFVLTDLEISPFRLPLQAGVLSFGRLFEGLPGVFHDSLPDGWGRLLFDRFARSKGVLPADLSVLDRLAHVGMNGMGALVYEPDHSLEQGRDAIHLDHLATQVQAVLEGSANDVLQELLELNGSSSGARPKVLVGINQHRQNIIHGGHQVPEEFDPWLVKFANTQDGPDAGAIEYVYALMAKEAGLRIPDVHLFPAEQGAGYFAIQRFDRQGNKRFHMHTAAGLLHSDFRTPSLDYEDLMALTVGLTRDVREGEEMFRLAVFNVLAHNRDDHAKNFSFLMNEEGQWRLSPAYDLTFSSGPGGEQSTMVMGEGKNPTVEHLLSLGRESKMAKRRVDEIIDETRASLSGWSKLAKEYGVSASMIKLIAGKISD